MKGNIIHKNIDRVWEIDFLRGFSVALMIFDHLMFLVAFVFGPAWESVDFNNHAFFEGFYNFANNYGLSELRRIGEEIFACIFICVCGISTNFSKNNFKRGYLLLLLAFAISTVTYLVAPENFIHFGIISLLATSILVWELFNRLLNKNKKYMLIFELILMLSLVIFDYLVRVLPIDAPNDFCGFLTFRWAYQTFFNSPGDFFPLIPYMAVFMFGSIIGNLLYSSKKSIFPKGNIKLLKPINFLGRHSLIFYILPQAIFALILSILSLTLVTGNLVIF